MPRAPLWVLLPGCLIYALLLVSQGVVQNFRPYDQAKLVQPQTVTSTGTDGKDDNTDRYNADASHRGPSASQEAIKMLGTTAAVSSMPTARIRSRIPHLFSNLLQMFSIFVIPAGLTVTLGR